MLKMGRVLKTVCLIQPKRELWAKTERISRALQASHRFLKAWYSPSLSLLTIAALTPADIQVEYTNEDFAPIDFDGGYGVVGITTMTPTAERAYRIADLFRQKGVYVVIGGVHASARPEEAALHADSVIVGEAEELWPRFLQDFREGEPLRIYRNPTGHFSDLSRSNVPRYDLLRGRQSLLDPEYFYNFVPIQTSRGCPHDCEFCLVSGIYGKRARKKTVGQVRREILAIKKHVPNRLVLFADDNLFVDRRSAVELLAEIEKLGIRWIGQSDVSIGEDDELLELLYRSGCLFLLIGLESLNAENLGEINPNRWKLRQLKNYERNIRNIQEHGVMVFGAFMFGFDHDHPTVFQDVVGFMDRNHLAGQLTFVTPLPGTRMYNRLRQEERFLYAEPFWERCTFLDVIFKLKNMSKEQAEEGFLWAYQQIFNENAFNRRADYIKDIYKQLSSSGWGVGDNPVPPRFQVPEKASRES